MLSYRYYRWVCHCIPIAELYQLPIEEIYVRKNLLLIYETQYQDSNLKRNNCRLCRNVQRAHSFTVFVWAAIHLSAILSSIYRSIDSNSITIIQPEAFTGLTAVINVYAQTWVMPNAMLAVFTYLSWFPISKLQTNPVFSIPYNLFSTNKKLSSLSVNLFYSQLSV